MNLEQLHRQQMENFELAKQNFAALQQVIYREIPFKHFTVRLQYNPARIRSTNANTDQAAIQSRPCFLCPQNMPEKQTGIAYGNRYRIYVNPYPIFHHHFTVPTDAHVPQRIEQHIEDLLHLAFDFPDYTVFYNGPGAGASAPDHFHFQLAPRHQMPLEEDVNLPQLRKTIRQESSYSISSMENYLREAIVFQTADRQTLVLLFKKVQHLFGKLLSSSDEPMMNLLCWFEEGQWTLCLFPRKLGRPKQFFAEGEEKILFSPGCVDMAGLIIAPRREDFERYSTSLLTDLFEQVTLTREQQQSMVQILKELSL